MDIITTPAAVYSPPSTAILHNTTASLTDRSPTAPVHLVQYDQAVPVIAVSLTEKDSQYTVPSGAAVNVRMDKPDGKHVYDPALGVSEDSKTVYIGVTAQMTAAWGRSNPIVEIVIDGGIVGTAAFPIMIDQNPVPDSAYESTDEYLTLYEILQQAQNAAQIVQENAQNLQNLTDNLEAVQNAAANAQAAAASAAAAQQAAQEALGFRTFFSAITPDANGSLDPSRPMTTPSAQASWTIESKGDRIQSVQVNGFTQQAGTGDPSPTNVREISTAGLRMVAVTFDGSADEAWAQQSAPAGYRYYIALPGVTTIDASTGTAFASNLQIGAAGSVGQPGNSNIFTVAAGNLYVYTNGADLATFKQQLAAHPLTIWYVPADESQATGLYIPKQAQGHEYRCEMMKLTAPLCDGDKVESCVPSACDVKMILDGSQSISWVQNSAAPYGGYFQVSAPGLPSFLSGSGVILADRLRQVDNNFALFDNGVMVASTTAGKLNFTLFGQKSVGDANEYLASNPISIRYRSTAYTEQNDIPVQLETHGFGVYTVTGEESISASWTDTNNPNLYTYTFKVPFSMVNMSPNVVCNQFATSTTLNTNALAENKVLCSTSGLYFCFDGVSTAEDAKAFFAEQYAAGTPVVVVVPLSTPAVYARDPVALVAVPYTAADVAAANQLANTPSTLPAIDSPDVPMLLDAAEPEPTAPAALAANAIPVAGAYVVSSQDNTTVLVSLKAFQDGGDAATLGGLTAKKIQSAAFAAIDSNTAGTLLALVLGNASPGSFTVSAASNYSDMPSSIVGGFSANGAFFPASNSTQDYAVFLWQARNAASGACTMWFRTIASGSWNGAWMKTTATAD